MENCSRTKCVFYDDKQINSCSGYANLATSCVKYKSFNIEKKYNKLCSFLTQEYRFNLVNCNEDYMVYIKTITFDYKVVIPTVEKIKNKKAFKKVIKSVGQQAGLFSKREIKEYMKRVENKSTN